jgi:hypothetical protein
VAEELFLGTLHFTSLKVTSIRNIRSVITAVNTGEVGSGSNSYNLYFGGPGLNQGQDTILTEIFSVPPGKYQDSVSY